MENNNYTENEELLDNELANEAEETSYINCENFEEEVPFDAGDDTVCPTASVMDRLNEKFAEIREACKCTAQRLSDDWKQANGNPYLRETTTYKVEVLRNKNDEEPIDTFETENSKTFSAKSLAIAGGVAAVLVLAAGKIVRNL